MKSRGFTLIELLIVVALTAILMSLAVPSFRTFLVKRAVTAAVDTFVMDFRFARSEALKRSAPVSVCQSSNGTSCSTTSGQWAGGWLVFADANGNGSLDTGDNVLRVQAAPASLNSIASTNPSGDRTFFTYSANGLSIAASHTFIFTPSGSVPSGTTRLVCFSNQGRVAPKAASSTSCS